MKKDYLELMRQGKELTLSQLLRMTIQLSLPTILAQISIIIVEYIDQAMVGKLGAEATASIGLVASTTWLFGGLCHSIGIGFSVIVAQKIGAGDNESARRVMKQGLLFSLLFALGLTAAGIAIHPFLPHWLGGEQAVLKDASAYFLIFALALPFRQLNTMAAAFLQSSGNTKTPGILETLVCVADVVFNFIFIYGFSLGVTGAAIGSALAEAVIVFPMLYALLVKSEQLKLVKGEGFRFVGSEVKRAVKIAVPTAVEQLIMSSAYITSMRIVAPLGSVSIAAHSLAITAESFCYMPGFGIAAAATAIIGQCIGAKREDLRRRLSYITVGFGMVLMGLTGVAMYFLVPAVMRLLTPVTAVAALGVEVLRIELFAEPMFAASIVATGVFRGAGDTLAPSVMNLVSMWGVRITLSLLLVGTMGLQGIWTAMLIELCFRGTIFLARLVYKNQKIKRQLLAESKG